MKTDIMNAESMQVELTETMPEQIIDELSVTESWYIVITTSTGEQYKFFGNDFLNSLKTGLQDGTFTAEDLVVASEKKEDGTWTNSQSTLAEFSKNHFALRKVFQPVLSFSLEGLSWGIIIGIALKLLDTLITFALVDLRMAFFFIGAIAVCFIPRIGLIGVAVISFLIARYTGVNFFLVGLVSAITGAILGVLPGLAVGGLTGLIKRNRCSPDPKLRREPSHIVYTAVVLPFISAILLFWVYLFVFNPWLVDTFSK